MCLPAQISLLKIRTITLIATITITATLSITLRKMKTKQQGKEKKNLVKTSITINITLALIQH